MNESLAQAREVLRAVFGFSEFRLGQEAVLQDILQGKDVVVVMPTGGGKSLLYQLPAVLWKSTVLVISPLISLMQDQVASLRQRNIAATFINSTLNADEKKMATQDMEAGRYRLVYVSPERLQYPEFQESLRRTKIAMLAIDEAHCISQWGHDFRPDYLKIKGIRELLGGPATAAFTATATEEVRQEIAEKLGLSGRNFHVAGFNRENLYFEVRPVLGQQDKIEQIRRIHASYGPCGIVYAGTRKNVEYVAENLAVSGIPAAPYHAGMDDQDRYRVQHDFMSEKVPLVVATNAFGMGVNKPNIRFVVHFDIPANMEAYYQEVGRAGRDGKYSYCCLLFNYADTRIPRFFIEESHPAAALVKDMAQLIETRRAVLPVEELQTMYGAKSQMSIRYALNLLDRAGIVKKTIPADYSYCPSTNGVSLDTILRLDQKRKRREERELEQIIQYAYSDGCRRTWILGYFGEHTSANSCHACDNCNRMSGLEEACEEKRIEVLKALSAVARINGRVGKNCIAEVLVGAKSKKVVELDLHRIPTYGALDYMTVEQACQLLDVLIQVGDLRLELKDGQYPLLCLTPLGYEVVMSRHPCYLPAGWSSQAGTTKKGKKKSRHASRQTAPAETPVKAKKSATKNTSSATSQKGGKKAAASDNSDMDQELYDKLSELRHELASQADKPAFVVFPNTTLQEMATRKPKTLAALAEISGVGKFKLQNYGAAFLAVIQTHG